MDEEITIIDSNTRNERIKNFFINNKKKLISIVSIILVIIIGYLSFEKSKERTKIKLANKYNLALIDLNPDNKQKTIDEMVNVVKSNDATYSPLALYHLLDNNLLKNNGYHPYVPQNNYNSSLLEKCRYHILVCQLVGLYYVKTFDTAFRRSD